MGMVPTSDLSAADWIADSELPFERLTNFGPAGFEAWARLRFIPDPSAPGQQEADVELHESHLSDLAQTQRALTVLADFTETASDCFFAVWEGYSDIPFTPKLRAGPMVEIPHRRFILLCGPLSSIDSFAADWGEHGVCAPPAFVWPRDRRWCLASDVDPHWAGIGAGRAAIEALLADPVLDVVGADPSQSQPNYY